MSGPGLRPRSRFREVMRRGRSSSGLSLVIKALPGQEGLRVGVIVTKKLGGAVKRNRIRRRIKGALAEIGNNVPRRLNSDMIVIAKGSISTLSSGELREKLRQGMEELGIIGD